MDPSDGRPGRDAAEGPWVAPRATPRRSGDALSGLRRLGAALAGSRARPPRGGAHRRTHRHTRRWPHRALVVTNVLSALALVIAASGYGYVQWRLGQIKRISVGGLHRQGHSAQSGSAGGSIAPFTILVIGSDTRNLSSGQSAQFGTGTAVAGQRSDSIILVRVIPKTRSIGLLSIPRDTLVPIPGHGTTRINIAFDSGQPTLLVQVLDQDFGIQVNHVVVFTFDTFRQVANAVGGVEQYFPSPARDLFSLLHVPSAGCVNLNGLQALGFVRSREYQYYLQGSWHYQLYPESDLARIQRQQAFVRGLIHKAKAVAPTDLLELNNLIGSVTRNLVLDRAFSNSLLLSLAQIFRHADLSAIPSYTYPDVNSTRVYGALDPQVDAGRALISQWLAGGAPSAPGQPSGPTSTTVPSTSVTTVVSPSAVAVQVLNGSGRRAQAAQAGQVLQRAGYRVTVGGDAPVTGQAATTIYYAPDSQAAAQQLATELNVQVRLAPQPLLGPSPYNLQVVTGENFPTGANLLGPGLPGSGPAASTTTVPPSPAYSGTVTVDPASSSFYQGRYIPPGRTPGQIPPDCGL